MSDFVIAIDGPSGTGKSTVSRRVATALGAGYLDTGALYRVVSLAVLRAGIDPRDDDAVANLLRSLVFDVPTDPAGQRHLLAGDDVSAEIRRAAVTQAVTPVSANPAVRAFLLERQVTLAHAGRMVVEGRDIGTVIAPDAPLKVYLTADPDERARRRYRQTAGVAAAVEQAPANGERLGAVAADLLRRDTADATRAVAPLQIADDAVLLDSSMQSVDQTVAAVLALAAERGIA